MITTLRLEDDTELYALESALQDAIAAQERAASSFRASGAYTAEQRERLARSIEDRAVVLRRVLARLDAYR